MEVEIPELETHSFNKICNLTSGRSDGSISLYNNYDFRYQLRSIMLGVGKMHNYFSSYLFNKQFSSNELDLVFYFKLDTFIVENTNKIMLYDNVSKQNIQITDLSYYFLVKQENISYYRYEFFVDLSYCENNAFQIVTIDNEKGYYKRYCKSLNYYKLPIGSNYEMSSDRFGNLKALMPFTFEITFLVNNFTINNLGIFKYKNSNIEFYVWISSTTLNINLKLYSIEDASEIESEVLNFPLEMQSDYENTLFIIAKYSKYNQFALHAVFNNENSSFTKPIMKESFNFNDNTSSITLGYSGTNSGLEYLAIASIRVWNKGLTEKEIIFYEKKILAKEISTTDYESIKNNITNQTYITNQNNIMFYIDFRIFVSITEEGVYEGISNIPLSDLPKLYEYDETSEEFKVEVYSNNFLTDMKLECGESMIYSKSDENTLTCDNSNIADFYCEDNEFIDSSIDIYGNIIYFCSKCSKSCKGCILSSENCKQCEGGRYPVQYIPGSCIMSNTLEHFYIDKTNPTEKYWKECDANCKNCFDSTDNSCIDCRIGDVSEQYTCSNTCSPGTYLDLDFEVCKECSPQCATCKDSSDYCLSCSYSFFFLSSNNCVNICPQGLFEIDQVCYECDKSCLDCKDNKTKCNICATNYYPIENDETHCVSTCPFDHYLNKAELKCMKCDEACLTCEIDSTICTSCSDTILYESVCVSTCPNGYYEDKVKNECKHCYKNCLTCQTSGNQCITCQPDLIHLNSGECIKECDKGKLYLDNSCIPCDPPCSVCKDSLDYCTSCVNGFFLEEDKGDCVLTCKEGYYGNELSKCVSCSSPCSGCSSLTNCTSCIAGYFLLEDKCVKSCPEYTYSTKSISVNKGGECKYCSANCPSCSDSQICIECEPEYVLISINQNIISTLLPLYVSSLNIPFEIDSNVSICIQTCPQGFFESNSTCYKCSDSCLTCESSSTFCTSCKNNHYFDSVNNSCFETLPSGTYYNTELKSILKCDSTCKTCFGPTFNSCLSCYEDSTLSYLRSNECTELCLSNQLKYFDTANNVYKCLDFSTCVSFFKINLNQSVDIESTDAQYITLAVDFTVSCINILTSAGNKLGYSDNDNKIASINSEYFSELFILELVFPDSFSTDNYIKISETKFGYHPNPQEEGFIEFSASIKVKNTNEIIGTASSLVLLQIFNIVADFNDSENLLDLSEYTLNEDYDYGFSFDFGLPIYINAASSFDEKWEGLNVSNEVLTCNWECFGDFKILCEENLVNTEKDDCEFKVTDYSNLNFFIEYFNGNNQLEANILLTITNPSRKKSSEFNIYLLIKKDESLLDTMNLIQNSSSSSSSSDNSESSVESIISNSSNSSNSSSSSSSSNPFDFDNLENKDETMAFLQKIINITVNTTPYYIELTYKLLTDAVAAIEVDWELDNETSDKSSRLLNTIYNSHTNNNLQDKSYINKVKKRNLAENVFLTPSNQKIIKLDLNELPNGENIAQINLKFSETITVAKKTSFQNYYPPKYGICTSDKATVKSISDKIKVDTGNWDSHGKLKYSLIYLDSYTTRIADYQFDKSFTVENLPIGSKFYIEAYDIVTGKTGLASCSFEVVASDNINYDEINSNLQQKTTNPEANLNLMVSLISNLTTKPKTNTEKNSESDSNLDSLLNTFASVHNTLISNNANADSTELNKVIFQSNSLSKASKNPTLSTQLVANTNAILKKYSNKNLNELKEVEDSIFDTCSNMHGQTENQEIGILVDRTFDGINKITKNNLSLNEKSRIYKDAVIQVNEVISSASTPYLNTKCEESNNSNTNNTDSNCISSSSNIQVGERILQSQNLFPLKKTKDFNGFSKDAKSLDLASISNEKNATSKVLINVNATHSLTIPNLSDEDNINMAHNSFCGVYDSEKNMQDSDCQTWYDYESNTSECDCKKTGTVMTIFSLINTENNKNSQFPKINYSLCKLLF